MKSRNNGFARLMALHFLIATTAVAQPAEKEPAAEISEEELIAFSESIDSSMNSGDDSFFNDHMDFKAMADEITAGIATNPGLRKGFTEGFTSDKGAFGREILSSVNGGGSYDFLRIVTEEDQNLALFRLLGPGGLNYHKLFVFRRADGELAIRDIDVALTGERITQTVRRIYIPMAIQAGGPPTPESKELLEATELIAKFSKQRSEGKFDQALKTYARIPKKHQMIKAVQLMRMGCAMNISDDEYGKVMAECAPLFKDDISADMLAIDANLLQGKYEESHAAIDRVNARIGGDPYLDTMHGGLYSSQKEYDKAREAANRSLAADPHLMSAHDLLLTIALAEQDHPETARLLELFTAEYGLQFGDLADAPGFEEFIKSAEYKQWMENKATP